MGHIAALRGGPLIEILIDAHVPEWLRSNAAMAIGQIGSDTAPTVEALTRALGDADAHVRDAARRSLSRLGH